MSDRAERIQNIITDALNTYQSAAPRSLQSAEGILGPSDIGFCRQKAVLMTKGVPQTDNPPKWSAAVGTAIHNYVEAAIKAMHPDWIVGSIDHLSVTATLPSGAEISGHPDLVVPSANAVLDIKTVDGFDWVRREGTSKQHKFQRHLYAMGLIQGGILDGNRPVLVGNVYFDRSGKQHTPMVLVEEMDATLTDEIDSWVQDVIYAVKHSEDASRDVPAAVCERICAHFTACRGGLETHDGGEDITDSELLTAVDMYVEARELEKQATGMKKAAQEKLAGINGTTGTWQVRWVDVAPTRVDAFEKNGYSRLDIRAVRNR